MGAHGCLCWVRMSVAVAAEAEVSEVVGRDVLPLFFGSVLYKQWRTWGSPIRPVMGRQECHKNCIGNCWVGLVVTVS